MHLSLCSYRKSSIELNWIVCRWLDFCLQPFIGPFLSSSHSHENNSAKNDQSWGNYCNDCQSSLSSFSSFFRLILCSFVSNGLSIVWIFIHRSNLRPFFLSLTVFSIEWPAQKFFAIFLCEKVRKLLVWTLELLPFSPPKTNNAISVTTPKFHLNLDLVHSLLHSVRVLRLSSRRADLNRPTFLARFKTQLVKKIIFAFHFFLFS